MAALTVPELPEVPVSGNANQPELPAPPIGAGRNGKREPGTGGGAIDPPSLERIRCAGAAASLAGHWRDVLRGFQSNGATT